MRTYSISTLALAALCLATGAAHAASTDRQATPSHSARAAFSGAPQRPFLTAGQPNKLQAASQALQACRTNHPQSAADAGYCELTHLDGAKLTSAAAIRSKVPEQPHPLYLWRYTKGTSTVYLGGSIHILKPGLGPPPPQFQRAFELSDNLVLEANIGTYSQQQLQQITMSYAALPAGQDLTTLLPGPTFKALDRITTSYGLPLAKLARFKPSFVNQQLAVAALMSVGYDPSLGVENYFLSQAEDKTLLELEGLEFQLDLLLNQPLPVQVSLIEEIIPQMDQFENLTADMLVAWMSGDDAAFREAFDAQTGNSAESTAFMEKLLDERNIGMAEKIGAYLNMPGTWFVLVGAAHYIGDNSIIRLLARRGFRGQRIFSNDPL